MYLVPGIMKKMKKKGMHYIFSVDWNRGSGTRQTRESSSSTTKKVHTRDNDNEKKNREGLDGGFVYNNNRPHDGRS